MRATTPLWLSLLAASVRAEPPPARPVVPLAADRLSTARAGRQVPDHALRALLTAEQPPRRQVLGVLRAAPFAAEPERLVPGLCRWAASRDPHLAPQAARSLYEIAAALDPQELAVREVSVAALRQARAALLELQQHEPAPRDDIVFAARYAEARLGEVLAQLVVAAKP